MYHEDPLVCAVAIVRKLNAFPLDEMKKISKGHVKLEYAVIEFVSAVDLATFELRTRLQDVMLE